MKKRSLLIAFSLLLTLTFLGPAPAFAADHSPQSSQSGGAGFIMESVNTAFGMQRMLFG